MVPTDKNKQNLLDEQVKIRHFTPILTNKHADLSNFLETPGYFFVQDPMRDL